MNLVQFSTRNSTYLLAYGSGQAEGFLHCLVGTFAGDQPQIVAVGTTLQRVIDSEQRRTHCPITLVNAFGESVLTVTPVEPDSVIGYVPEVGGDVHTVRCLANAARIRAAERGDIALAVTL